MRGALLVPLALMACQEIQISGGSDLSASGDAPDLSTPTQTDVTKQTTIPEVDILWVVDNSCSMADEQQSLAQNFGAFIQFFVGSGLDYHVGVVTTDTDAANAGKLRLSGGVRYIDSATADPEAIFSDMTRVGTNGSADERGLRATQLAIGQPNAGIQTANAGYYRDGAALHVVVVSDEEDYSGNMPTVPEMITWLQALKPAADIPVTFNSIVGPRPNGCDGGAAANGADAGTRYLAVTDSVGGVTASICDADWYAVLEELGLRSAGLKREYYLTQVPVADTIEVLIVDGGREVYGINQESVRAGASLDEVCDRRGYKACEWFYYDARRNAVVFPEYLPGALAEVNITYELRSALEAGAEDEESDAEAEDE